ncbi:MAG: AMP-binding protein, partial [Acidimicrobiales bacterium]
MTGPDVVPAQSFSARFDQLARERSGHAAVTFVDETLTFAELDAAANRLARHLDSLGVSTDRFVTIAEPNSVEFIVAVLACW